MKIIKVVNVIKFVSFFQTFGSDEQLTAWVQNIARGQGFVIVKGRTKSDKGYLYEINYRCFKSGDYNPSGTGKRKSSTCKTNCPFRLLAKYHATKNYWVLRVMDDTHNHVLLDSLHGVPFAMRLANDEFGLVGELTECSVKPRHILSTIQARNPDNVSSVRTIYNAKNKIRRAREGGRTPIQVLYEHLMESGYTWYPRVNEHTNELEELFFVHPTSYAIWCTFPEIMLMDSTYNTTMFKLPLLEIVGVTSTNKTFSMAYSFLNTEQGHNFQWVLERVKDVIDERYYPRVIVTDRDLALVGACRAEFPNAHHLLCRWHIEQNLSKYCKNKCSDDDYTTIKRRWNLMVKAPTYDGYERHWQRLQQLLVNHPGT